MVLNWLQRIASDHGDGTNHRWESEFGYIFRCGTCGEVDFGERID